MRLLLGIIALLVATPAMATDFVVAAEAGNEALLLGDRDSVQQVGNGRVRVHMLYVMRDDLQGMAALEMTNEYDCPNRRYRRIKIQGVDAQGAVIIDEEPKDEWREAVDGDASGTMLDFICKGTISSPTEVSIGKSVPSAIIAGRRRMTGG